MTNIGPRNPLAQISDPVTIRHGEGAKIVASEYEDGTVYELSAEPGAALTWLPVLDAIASDGVLLGVHNPADVEDDDDPRVYVTAWVAK